MYYSFIAAATGSDDGVVTVNEIEQY